MKITIDVDKLLAEGHINEEEYARLKSFAIGHTWISFFNVIVCFGVWSTVLGALLMVPSNEMALSLAFIMFVAAGIIAPKCLDDETGKKCDLVLSMMLSVATLLASGAILNDSESHYSAVKFLLVALVCVVGGLLSGRSSLMVIATLALSSSIGVSTFYSHAQYSLVVSKPFLTIAVFNLVGWGSYYGSFRLDFEKKNLAIAVARTSFFLVNFGFWVGSLWGDYGIDMEGSWKILTCGFYTVTWAVCLFFVAAWGAKQGSTFTINTAATFGAINFYTKYFEYLGANPIALLGSGLVALVGCSLVARFNDTLQRTRKERKPLEDQSSDEALDHDGEPASSPLGDLSETASLVDAQVLVSHQPA